MNLLHRALRHKCQMPPPRLLDQVRETARLRHLGLRTGQFYAGWVRRFVLFHGKRHPRELGAAEIRAFLSYLAAERHVAASARNEALAAILFLYRGVLKIPCLTPVLTSDTTTRTLIGSRYQPRRIKCHRTHLTTSFEERSTS